MATEESTETTVRLFVGRVYTAVNKTETKKSFKMKAFLLGKEQAEMVINLKAGGRMEFVAPDNQATVVEGIAIVPKGMSIA